LRCCRLRKLPRPRMAELTAPTHERVAPWICPEHQLPLQDTDGGLACPRGEVFAVRHGVPRFVADEGYAAAFGSQWHRHRLTQLDSRTGLTISEERARRCLGEELWTSLAGKSVLECGCGAGLHGGAAREGCTRDVHRPQRGGAGERGELSADVLAPRRAGGCAATAVCAPAVRGRPLPGCRAAHAGDHDARVVRARGTGRMARVRPLPSRRSDQDHPATPAAVVSANESRAEPS
jgi:hypothetical protein